MPFNLSARDFYSCEFESDEKFNLKKKLNSYTLTFTPANTKFNFKIYQESKELLVIGEISNEEGEFEEQEEDAIVILTLSKIDQKGKMISIENNGETSLNLSFNCN